VDDDEEYCPAGDEEEGEDKDKDEGAKEENNDKAIGDEEESLVAEEEEENKDQLYRDVWVKKRGSMTEQERSQCRELGLEVVRQVETLAKELQRSMRSVLLEAGIITQKAHGLSLSNMYRAWLTKNEPKTKEGMYIEPRSGCVSKHYARNL
jgi:hypothetical protein